MQSTETEINNDKVTGDDERINFRPSPNFKHMKKYLKYKFEEMSGNQEQPEQQANMMNVNVTESERVKNKTIQPPLPPNPPPLDCPIILKKEIEDDEYINNNEENSSAEVVTGSTNDKKKQEKIMCRRFARGECDKSAAACIYTHEIILSQLPAVYTFCKNFQNAGCELPKCKFVHATVFEKEHYFRTGYLPPHTIAHLKKNNSVNQPPPQVNEAAASEVPPIFTHPPPNILPGGFPLPVMGCAPRTLNDIEKSIPDVLGNALSISPLKRQWPDIDDINDSNCRNLDSNAPLIKKCKYCDINQFRLECAEKKVEKKTKSVEDQTKKVSDLIKMNDKLFALLDSLIKINDNGKGTNILKNLSISNSCLSKKEKTTMDQFNMFFSANNKISLNGEEKNNISNLSSTSTSKITSLLVKLFLNSRNQSISGDAS